ncbi:hypothetical protein GJ744_012336 [Endocarpon pusillum]|uniref:Uncharacterized protein n=1 Tax=Endocarpon pusillum TaxID=364733 RepID=A0A8H7E0E5_9EURO|nr:hypothetical protein GJ744_012336 [Endocarpon pusillum]
MLTRLKPNSSNRKRHEDRQAEHHLPSFSTTSLSSSENSCDTPVGSSKQKAKVVDASEPPNTMPSFISARSSPLDEPPRLITFTKAGQGFNWNEELFLPSYMISRYSRSRRKQYDGDLGEDDVEVAEISVTDEEANNMMP